MLLPLWCRHPTKLFAHPAAVAGHLGVPYFQDLTVQPAPAGPIFISVAFGVNLPGITPQAFAARAGQWYLQALRAAFPGMRQRQRHAEIVSHLCMVPVCNFGPCLLQARGCTFSR